MSITSSSASFNTLLNTVGRELSIMCSKEEDFKSIEDASISVKT
ncbi:hypothetical protein [Methanococcus maripaludis]|nr:hypothetical protein [Methanococcus maripaludis]